MATDAINFRQDGRAGKFPYGMLYALPLSALLWVAILVTIGIIRLA